MNPWEDPTVRMYIDEWMSQHDSCVKKLYPAGYGDRWGRICGTIDETLIQCNQNPDNDYNGDHYQYLWRNNVCAPCYTYTVQLYVEEKLAGASSESLAICTSIDGSCY